VLKFKKFILESNIKIRTDGHYDVHGLTPEHISWITSHPNVISGSGHISLTLPDHLPAVPNSLVGPRSGDEPISDNDPRVFRKSREGGRNWESKMIRGPKRMTRDITAVIKVDDNGERTLHTAYGGPKGETEVGNPNIKPEDVENSKHFWSQHALLDGENQ